MNLFPKNDCKLCSKNMQNDLKLYFLIKNQKPKIKPMYIYFSFLTFLLF